MVEVSTALHMWQLAALFPSFLYLGSIPLVLGFLFFLWAGIFATHSWDNCEIWIIDLYLYS